MNFTCDRYAFQRAVLTAARAAAAKSSIPALTGLLIHADADGELDGIEITGYNSATAITAKVSCDTYDCAELDRIVIDAKILSEIVRKLPDEPEVNVQAGEDFSVQIACGVAKYRISGLDPEAFVSLEKDATRQTLTLTTEMLHGLISGTAFAVSNDDARPVYTGARLEVSGGTAVMVACDGFRIAMRSTETDYDMEPFACVIPGGALAEIDRVCVDYGPDEAVVTVGERHVWVTLPDVEVVTRQIDGDFFDWRAALPKDQTVELDVSAKALLESLNRVGVVVDTAAKAGTPVRCRFDDGRAELSVRSGKGNARDELDLCGDGGGLEIGFSARFLSDALKHTPGGVVRLGMSTPLRPMTITPGELQRKGENWLHLVLPVRLRND